MTQVWVIGLGFVGSHLSAYLLGQGLDVTAMDIYNKEKAFNYSHLRRYQTYTKPAVPPEDGQVYPGQFKYVKRSAGDSTLTLRELSDVGNRLSIPDYIVYTTAVADVDTAEDNPIYTQTINTMYSTAFMDMLRRADFGGKFVGLSSEGVYGKQPEDKIPLKEDTMLLPDSNYAQSKANQENTFLGAHRAYGINSTVLRSSTLYGDYGRTAQVMPQFMLKAMQGDPIIMMGDGSTSRDFNHIDNLVRAIYATLLTDNLAGEIINVGSGREIRLDQLARTIIGVIRSKSKIEYTDFRPGEKGKRMQLDISKAQRLLGYRPVVDLLHGMNRTMLWLAEHELRMGDIQLNDLRRLISDNPTQVPRPGDVHSIVDKMESEFDIDKVAIKVGDEEVKLT